MKKTTLILTALFATAYSFAQLNVRNNAFVYVDDEVLFVTEEVNLQETTTNLYLRNESQLLQGASQSVANTGQGRLSVIQEGDASVYTHNIWASPVGNVTAGSSGNRAFTPSDNIWEVGTNIDPTLAPITSFQPAFIGGYNSVGSTPGTTSNMQIASYWFWKYLPGTSYADWVFVGDAGTVDAGYAFTMKGTNVANQAYDFRGKPNSGTITTNVNLNQYTMIGNPYPSALDTVDFIHDAANAGTLGIDPLLSTGTLYFWEQQDTGSHNLVNYLAGYATYTINAAGTVISYTPATMDSYNADGTLNTTGAAGTKPSVLRYLPIGQGFMVVGGANGVITTRNSHRDFEKESGGSSIYFKTEDSKNNKTVNSNSESNAAIVFDADGLQIMPSDYKRFRLNVDFNDTYTRQLLHNFHDSCTDDLDYGLETRFPTALSSDIWFPREEEKLATNANRFDIDLKIPLNLVLDTEQSVRFRIFDVQNFDTDQAIFVHDKQLDLYYDLTLQNFDIALPSGNYASRFEITFKDNSKQIDIVEDELGLFNIFQNNNAGSLNLINPREANVTQINVYDVTGKRIFNSLDMNTKQRFEISTRNLSEGLYVIKVDFENGTSKSKKVIVSQN